MGLLNLLNKFTRRFRRKKKRKTRRSRGGTRDKHTQLAREALLRNYNKNTGRDLNAKYYIAKIENKSPEEIMGNRKTRSGRISPPPQSPKARPGMGGGRRKKKTRRRRKGGAGVTHSSLARQAMCQKKGGTWRNNKCNFTNPQEGSGKSRRRLRRRKR